MRTDSPSTSIWQHAGVVPLALGLFVSELGSWLTLTAFPLLVIRHTGITTSLGLTLGLYWTPNILLGPYFGARIDRWGAKRVAVIGVAVNAVVLASIPLMHTLLELQAIAIANGLTYTLGYPALMAVRPNVIPSGSELQGASVLNLADRAAKVGGPLLAGIFIASAGLNPLFVTDGATSLFCAAILLRIPRKNLTGKSEPDEVAQASAETDIELGAGLQGVPAAVAAVAEQHEQPERTDEGTFDSIKVVGKLLKNDAVLMGLTVTGFTYVVAFGMNKVLLPAVAVRSLHGIDVLGYMFSALGVGGVIGSILAPRISRVSQVVLYVGAMALEGLGWLALALDTSVWLIIAILIVIGIFESIGAVIYMAQVQIRVPGDRLGGYFGTTLPFFDGFLVLGAIGAGAIAGEWAVAGVGVAVAVMMGVPALVAIPSFRRMGAVAQ